MRGALVVLAILLLSWVTPALPAEPSHSHPAWIETAARRIPARVIPLAPVPDPMARGAPKSLDALLASGRFKGAGEVQVDQTSQEPRRATGAPLFRALLDMCARQGVPLVIHDDLTPETTPDLERARGSQERLCYTP